jgi:hypothetical protein
MSLIPCRECGHQISDKADSCSSCGAPSRPLVDREKYPDQLNGYFYRVEKDRSVSAVSPNGEVVGFRDWQAFWDAAGGSDNLLHVAATGTNVPEKKAPNDSSAPPLPEDYFQDTFNGYRYRLEPDRSVTALDNLELRSCRPRRHLRHQQH